LTLGAVSAHKQHQPPLALDDRLLFDVGLASFSAELKAELLVFLQDQLEQQVGATIAAQLSLRELDEFGSLVELEDDHEATYWLKTHFPGYGAVVRDELERLRGDLSRAASEIALSLGSDSVGVSR
jgi:hypothetical protein